MYANLISVKIIIILTSAQYYYTFDVWEMHNLFTHTHPDSFDDLKRRVHSSTIKIGFWRAQTLSHFRLLSTFS